MRIRRVALLALAAWVGRPMSLQAQDPVLPTTADAPSAQTSAAATSPPTPAATAGAPSHAPRSRFERRRWADLRVHRPVDFDYLRLGMPGGIGLGVRYLGIPGAGFDFAMATLFADTEIQLGISWYAVTTFRPSRVTPLLRLAYRRLHFLSHADQMLRGFGIDFEESDTVQLVLANTTLQGLSVDIGVNVITRRGTMFEIYVGRLWQVGGTTGQTTESGVYVDGLRMPTFGFTVGRTMALGRIVR